MKFSIVTVSFNQAAFLERAITSVVEQTGVDVEYIVVDAGSTDGSRSIISKYKSRIHKIIFESDRGAADGLNKGFTCATGDVLGFLNSDDYLFPGALAKVAEAFAATPDVDIVTGRGSFVDTNGVTLSQIIPSHLTAWGYAYGVVSVFQQGTFFKRSIYECTTGFNINNRTCWDGELFLDMCLAGARHKVINDRLAAFRLHAGSITGSGRLEMQYRLDNVRLFKKAIGREPNKRDRFVSLLARSSKYILQPSYTFTRFSAGVLSRLNRGG